MTKTHHTAQRPRHIGRSSLVLLVMLLLPAGIMAAMLFLQADATWFIWQAAALVIYLCALALGVRRYREAGGPLDAARKHWHDVFDSLEEAALIIGEDYVIEDANGGGLALVGASRPGTLGRKCYEALHGGTQPCSQCPVRRAMESGVTETAECYDEASERHYRLRSAPIGDDYSDAARFVYSITDTTDLVNATEARKMLQLELNRTSRLASIGEVAAGIAHEINNPLTGIVAFAQMLAQMDVPESMREAVEVINDGASRVVGIVDKLLAFARRDRPGKEHADINDILTSTIMMRAYEMRTNNVEAETSLAPDLPRTMVSIGQIQQVFLNLIVNAEQAMSTAHGRGTLRIATERADDRIRVAFADDGPGIPEGIIDKLFDPFFTTKRDGPGGTGLGLSISRGIVEEHDGKIYARSIEGKGATFVVDLPVVEPAVEEAPLPEPPQAKTASVPGASILVVDDEPHICTALDRLLTREGHSVETASEAGAALEKVRANTYDLVLLDLRMPGMNGIEFYRRMKEISPSLERRVVCVTGDVVSGINKDFLQETGIPCVAKPFGAQDLVQQIKEVLEANEKCASHVY